MEVKHKTVSTAGARASSGAQAAPTLTHGLSATQVMYSSKMPEQDLDMKGATTC